MKATLSGAALLLACATSAALAQTPAPGPVPTAACASAVATLNRDLRDRKNVDALLAAASLHEAGHCVERSDAKAAEYLGQAARAGSAVGARRLARKFATGQGVPQSYANAGAWLDGKGVSNEALGAWDYSIGYAYAVLTELLARVHYPVDALAPQTEAAFVVEINALLARTLELRPTAPDAAARGPLYAAVQAAFAAALPTALAALPAPDPKLLVVARVTQPVSLRLDDRASLDVLVDEPLLH